MDAVRFDCMTRAISNIGTRRLMVRGLFVVPGLAAVRLIDAATAKKKQKHKGKRRLKRNDYGCLNVGQPCKGNDALCCSGVCQGKIPKKGKRDKRTCAAHNTGGCTAAQDSCTVEQYVPCGTDGICTRTTGEATFCANILIGICMTCARDEDCYLWGPGAACIVCPWGCPQTTTACMAAAA